MTTMNCGGGNSNMFYFHPYLGKWSNLTNIFQQGWKPPTSEPLDFYKPSRVASGFSLQAEAFEERRFGADFHSHVNLILNKHPCFLPTLGQMKLLSWGVRALDGTARMILERLTSVSLVYFNSVDGSEFWLYQLIIAPSFILTLAETNSLPLKNSSSHPGTFNGIFRDPQGHGTPLW